MEEKMKIVHAFHHYYPLVGGMENAVRGLAEAQAKLGCEVYVVTSRYGAEDKPFKEVLNNVFVYRIDAWRLHYPDLTIPRSKPMNILREADVVHVHGHNSLFSMKILGWAFGCGIRTACYFMAVDAFKNHPSWFVRFLAPYYDKRNTERALMVADLRLVKSLRDMNILREKYGVETVYLPDAVSESYFTMERKDPVGFLEKYGIKQDKFFLFIGRIHKLKGPHILVEALKYLDKDIAAVFIGPDGGFLKKTLDLAKRIGVRDRVYFLGYVSEEDKIWAIDSAVALVLPTIADYVEVYPMVISEAWAREKSVIGSNVGGIPYRISHGLNGLLVNPSDPKALADSMKALVSNTGLAEKMGKQGKKDICTWKDIAIKSIKLYERALR